MRMHAMHRTKTREMEANHGSSANQTYETIITNAKAGMEGLTAKEKEHIKHVSHAGGSTMWPQANGVHACSLAAT